MAVRGLAGRATPRAGRLALAHTQGRIWLNLPRSPRTGKPRKVLFLWALPAFAANGLGAYLFARLDAVWTNWLPGFDEPSYTNPQALADPQFQGQWWILGQR